MLSRKNICISIWAKHVGQQLIVLLETEQDLSAWPFRSGHFGMSRFGLSRFSLGRFGHGTFGLAVSVWGRFWT